MKIKFKFILFILLILTSQTNYAQLFNGGKTVIDTFKVNLKNTYRLSSITIIPYSEKIKLNHKLLKRDEYIISYEKKEFHLSKLPHYKLSDTIIVKYKTFGLSLRKIYRRRRLIRLFEKNNADTIKIIRNENYSLSNEAIFGAGIQKSGTIVRGFTIGTNRDLTINSGLRLQLSGRLSKNLEIVAALTDENTPIQPEGNTEKLEELDKVFVKVRSPNVIGTFGDYYFKERIGEFGNIDRKLQGLKGEFRFGKQSALIAIASSRGKFNTNKFNGLDGVQGPYRLVGKNNRRNIIIIAGSESVYLDGEKLKRGENNDYTIEYGNAEITFTPKRLITSASRITVDFEYTDRFYQRNFFSSNIKTKFLNNRVNVDVNYFREGDDQNNLIDLSLSSKEKNILAKAGNDQNKAVISGVSLVKPDSTGIRKGTYTKVDTLIDGKIFSYYVYKPGETSSVYNVVFSYVGYEKGDYQKEGIGNYKFAGIGKGDYLPIKYLPMPSLKQMGNIVLNIVPLKGFNLSLELAGSSWDKNRFSNIGNSNNFGYAGNVNLSFLPRQIKLGGINFGKIGFSYKDRFIQDRFTTLDRINKVEFDRHYNINSQIKNNQELREIQLNLVPVKEISIYSKYGFLKMGSQFQSRRYLTNLKVSSNKKFILNYNFDFVKSLNNGLKTNWLRQNGNAYYLFGVFKVGLDFLAEDKRSGLISDTLSNLSYKYFETAPYVSLLQFKGFGLSARYSLRDESYPFNGIMTKESRAVTQNYLFSYHGIKEIGTTLSFTYRNKMYSKEFKNRGMLNNKTILIRSQTRMNFWRRFIEGNVYYQVSTQRTAKLEKIFVRVPVGTGNYIYLGDLNHNGIADENEFQPTIYNGNYILTTIPTDKLFPSINLKTNLRWKIDFGKIIKGGNFIADLLKPISTESYFRVEENSRDQDLKQIYLLNFSHFLNDKTTIMGSRYFRQDIYFFRNENNISLRFRYTERKSLNQFSGGIQRSYFREKSVRIKFRMVNDINNQTEFINQSDNEAAPINLARSRIVTNNNLVTNFSYRPWDNIELGFKINIGQSRNNLPKTPTIIDFNGEAVQFTLSLRGRGRLRVEVQRNELNANTLKNQIPFEITQGNIIGKNYLLRINFDYRIAGNLQITLNYLGRKQGSGKIINQLRAEARAYF